MAVSRVVPRTIYGVNSFCPGCGHGIVARLIAEVLEEMELETRAICSQAVGCSCLVARCLGLDMLQAAHGRASVTAAGIKRARPECFVFSYQGDGDAGAIGVAETVYSAQRNEKFTQIIINNGIYGMTGGQMSPATLPGQKATTAPFGRDPEINGPPVNFLALMEQFPVAYLARGSVHEPAEINKTRRYLKKAFAKQLAGEGFGCVEILSPCPTNWNMAPVKAMRHIGEAMVKYYPLGEVRGA